MLKSDFVMFLECSMLCYRSGCSVCHEKYPSIEEGKCPGRIALNENEEQLKYIIEQLKAMNEKPAQGISVEEIMSLLEEG